MRLYYLFFSYCPVYEKFIELDSSKIIVVPAHLSKEYYFGKGFKLGYE